MAQPSVTLNTQDGNLGTLPASGGRPLVVVGVASLGSTDIPTSIARDSELISTFGKGPAVDLASYHIKKTGKPVLFVKTGATVVGTYDTIDVTGVNGTSVVTVDAGTEPDNDYEIVVKIVVAGTIASPGITYQTSRDGGRNFGPITALGVASTITVLETGGITFDLAAGTLAALDTWSITGVAPKWNTGELTSAMQAVRNNGIKISLIALAGPCATADVNTFSSEVSGMASIGKKVSGFCHFRMKLVAESEATYIAAVNTEYAAVASTFVEVCAGDCELTVDAMIAKRPNILPIASITADNSISEHVASPLLGSLDVNLRDDKGNPKHHDETLNPGLQDERVSTLRTFNSLAGTYSNFNQLISALGSDFKLHAHRRVFNAVLEALDTYFVIRLNKSVRVDAVTGFIVEEDALEIENGARAAMRGAVLINPDASAVEFTLSRSDNLLSTSTLTGDASITPLAYLQNIVVNVGFFNPALVTSS